MTQAMAPAEALESLKRLSEWRMSDDLMMIYREYTMKNFKAAVELINRITDIAESMNHHPDLHLTAYKHLRLELTTHDAGGLTAQDFDMAARIDRLPAELNH